MKLYEKVNQKIELLIYKLMLPYYVRIKHQDNNYGDNTSIHKDVYTCTTENNI